MLSLTKLLKKDSWRELSVPLFVPVESYQYHCLLPVEFLPRNPAGNGLHWRLAPMSIMSWMISGGFNDNLQLWYCIICIDHLKGKQQKCEFWMERTISIKQMQYVWNSYLSWVCLQQKWPSSWERAYETGEIAQLSDQNSAHYNININSTIQSEVWRLV